MIRQNDTDTKIIVIVSILILNYDLSSTNV